MCYFKRLQPSAAQAARLVGLFSDTRHDMDMPAVLCRLGAVTRQQSHLFSEVQRRFGPIINTRFRLRLLATLSDVGAVIRQKSHFM